MFLTPSKTMCADFCRTLYIHVQTTVWSNLKDIHVQTTVWSNLKEIYRQYTVRYVTLMQRHGLYSTKSKLSVTIIYF